MNYDLVSQIDWARLSAYIDGEGYIGILKAGRASYTKMYQLRVIVSNTDFPLHAWLYSTFGGSVHESRGAKRRVFNWTVSCQMAAEILRRCMPYFIVKKEQAEIGLKFIATMGKTNQRVKLEVAQLREDLRLRLFKGKRKIYEGHPLDEVKAGSTVQ